MTADSRATRRAVLGRGALLLGGVAGSLGLAAAVESVRERTVAKPARHGAAEPMVLHGTDWHLQAADLERGKLPRRGDRVTVYGQLAPAPGNAPTGEFHATSMFLDMPLGAGPGAGAVMEIHNFTIPEGTLVGIGAARAGQSSVFTVVGGTGRYLGASGSYVARQDPVEIGGDGTATFTFDLRLTTGVTEGSNGAS